MAQEILNTDIVIVGAGAAGLAAALAAAEGGAKVVLLEKAGHTGGSGNLASGMFAVESELQRQRYIAYSRDQAFTAMMDYSHWRANPRLVRTFVDESSSTIAWLQKLGVEFMDVTTNMPDGPRTFHVITASFKAKGSVSNSILLAKAK
jgi:fumarate reductase flavoprotein subunit